MENILKVLILHNVLTELFHYLLDNYQLDIDENDEEDDDDRKMNDKCSDFDCDVNEKQTDPKIRRDLEMYQEFVKELFEYKVWISIFYSILRILNLSLSCSDFQSYFYYIPILFYSILFYSILFYSTV